MNKNQASLNDPNALERHFGDPSPPEEPQELPQTSKIQPKTQKNRSLKTIRFWHRFWKSLGFVLQRFLVRFFDEKRVETAKT